VNGEAEQILERYRRRSHGGRTYDALDPSVYMQVQERERALIRLIKSGLNTQVAEAAVLEVGCGSGGNLLELLRLGFSPGNMAGNELIPERAKAARERLPDATSVICGDATELPYPPGSFDIIYQSTVFSSILDTRFRAKLAACMWEMTRKGGAILWYDFAVNNPRNPDVRGVPVREVLSYFPGGVATVRWVTLAPPIARAVTHIHPSLYSMFNLIPLLRTHRLCWIRKP
jgi:SAM-dependent methyltransferase